MVEHTELDAVFRSLADTTRRDILRRLRSQERTVGELAVHYDLTFAAVSKHLQVLERAHLVKKRRHGRQQKVELVVRGLHAADKYLDLYRQTCESKLDRLEAFLKK
jgi:DNA-binding transcriptional ArsR family regulator